MSARTIIRVIGALCACVLFFAAARWSPQPDSPTAAPQLPTAPSPALPPPISEPAATAEDSPATKIPHEAKSVSFREEAERLNVLPLDGGVRAKALVALIERWILRDPRACMAFLETARIEPLRVSLTRRALELWLAADRVSAREFAETKIFENDRNSVYFLDPLLQDMLRRGKNPGAVLRYVETLPRTEQVYGEALSAFFTCAQLDYEAARNFAQRVPGRTQASFLTASGWAAARQRGTSLFDELGRTNTSAKWSPEEIAGVLGNLFDREPAETLHWLERQAASPAFDLARTTAAQKLWQKGEPEAALRLAGKISDVAMRDQLAKMILPLWAQHDYAAAEAWAIDSNLSAADVTNILAAAQKRPAPFEQRMAGILPTGDIKALRRSQSAVFMQWVQADPVAAARWLEQSDFSPDEKRSWASIMPHTPKE